MRNFIETPLHLEFFAVAVQFHYFAEIPHLNFAPTHQSLDQTPARRFV
jgi:hypothetical protein